MSTPLEIAIAALEEIAEADEFDGGPALAYRAQRALLDIRREQALFGDSTNKNQRTTIHWYKNEFDA